MKAIAAMLAGIAGIAGVIFGGQLYIDNSIHAYQVLNDQQRSQLNSQQMEKTQNQLTDISNSLKLAIQVLSKQVSFSRLITQIAKVIPEGAVMQSLNILKTEGGIDLVIKATDYTTATQAHINLQAPENKIFSKADIVSVICTEDSNGKKSDYPCTINIRALFSAGNDFLVVKEGE